jgi:hypothetical protein
MSMKLMVAFTASATALALGAPADATVLIYSLTGDQTANWELDTNQIPADASEGQGLIYDDIKGSFPAPLSNIAEVCFFNAGIGGGLQVNTLGTFDGVISTAGPQLYSGSEKNPTFLKGSFNFIGYDVVNEVEDPSRHYTLSVTSVPEPASWVMMVAGFGLGGCAIRRARKSVPTAA